MKKFGLGIGLSLFVLAAGCARDQEVVRYDVVEAHWTAEHITHDLEVQAIKAKDMLTYCEQGELLNDIEEDHLSLLGVTFASRMPFTEPDTETYAFNEASFVEGDAVYALCKSDHVEGYRAVKLEERPEFLKDETAREISLLPSVVSGTEEIRERLSREEAIHSYRQDLTIRPFMNSLYTISPGFNGSIEFGIGDDGVFTPYLDFAPYVVREDTHVALGYGTKTKTPYMLMSSDGIHYGQHSLNDGELLVGVDNLNVRTLLEGGTLEPLEPFPLYELTYESNGQKMTKTISIRFKPNPFITEPTDTDAVSIGYVHKYPYHPSVPFYYPDAVSIEGQGYERLTEALETGTPSTKSGEAGEYMYLTLLKGNRGQQFELSYHKRSQKVDVFVKDMNTDEQFKLSSEGAKIFHELFPSAVE
ncbi:hypothetical protein EVJ30_12165 [Exiguobacterium sp. SH5S13]|uniref:hypothetical protein n=1 Tax=unclassified Exiguobacterium TaxID=2644629 RepID=UPI00103EADBE|nr:MULTISPECIES: hypothetical protein [unclassified Exiguobacterium]TCI24401.1 hypothetical protein EVJ32_14315 [Exiguobacterium sp. SH5S4]TCI50817.1 hypothetical protein EVJ30_12165 [Exiguobacterium sp. SH5S13]